MADWKVAQAAVLERLADVRRLVDTRDESAVLALINQQDAFCEAAAAEKARTPGAEDERRCHFCEGYRQSGGCEARLDEIDRAVLHGEWDDVAKLIDEYADWVRSLDL